MSEEALKKLREPFPEHQISKLPKPTKKQTDEVRADFHKGTRCKICGTWHHPDVVHLDYVGHAALTDRLLDVDPFWTWEPLSCGPDGYPVIDKDGGMWIKLTVCGVTRLGYGDAQGKTGGDAMKERVGDALRNAAMRFGAALPLWHKGELHVDTEESDKPEKKPPSPPPKSPTEGRTDDGQGTASGEGVKGLSEAQTHLLNELTAYCSGDESEMGILLGQLSHYQKSDGKEGQISLADLRKPNDHAGFQKWIGSTLSKLRQRIKDEIGG